jgi:excinuclease UvrABC ATPase subunit
MDKPDVDQIEGLSPAISIDQKSASHNPRSTVGTVTEIQDYLRLLYAKIGIPHCPVCGQEITKLSVDEIVDRILEACDTLGHSMSKNSSKNSGDIECPKIEILSGRDRGNIRRFLKKCLKGDFPKPLSTKKK